MVSCPTWTNNLEWYLLQVHGDADGETHYSCDKCDYVNKSHPKYKEHINAIHTKEVVYLCDQCNFTTYRKSNLRPHLKNVHEKYKPNKCDKCFAAFLTKRELNKHFENKHPGLKWIRLLMPCHFTGPKMFWDGPNFLCQTKNLFTCCGSHKHFVPDKKMICIQ